MKKLKLNLDGKEMLSKEQMKKIVGGYGCNGGPVTHCTVVMSNHGGGPTYVGYDCCGTANECIYGYSLSCDWTPGCLNSWCS